MQDSGVFPKGQNWSFSSRTRYGLSWPDLSIQTCSAAFHTSVGFKSSLKFTIGFERAHSFSQEASPPASSGSVSDEPLSLESEELWKQISQ